MAATAQEPSATERTGHSGWTVLEYDTQGRVVGTRRGSVSEGAVEDALPDAAAPAPDARPAHEKAVESAELLVADPPAEAEAILGRLGFSLLERITLDALAVEMLRVRTPDDLTLPEAMRRLREAMPDALIDTNDLLDLSRGAGRGAGRDAGRVQIAQTRQDYARDAVGWGQVPESCGKGLVLGQIDGKVDAKHPALIDRDLVYESLIKADRRETAEDHGTAIAIMLIGKPRPGRSGGLLPGAKLYAANIFEYWKGRRKGNLAALIRAIDWLVGNGVQVANLAIEGGDNVLMRMATHAASAKGLIMVAAAGNHGPEARPAWPAAAAESLAVTAIDRGLELYPFANAGPYIDFAAPGVDVLTETPTGLRQQSGTSMATPFITAMVALHLDAGFPADPDKIRASMKRYAHDLGEEGRDSRFGWGLVRLRPNCR
ncbi:S8 family serine peptidase [Marivibrio halodurans]|uniref:S8 family serine peptidase n=1 Tax=Marivibrio halodurans TaxID=2039722 RepID=A0A8J7V3A3_9PROT|nr:S8 family serine peptidase [Marivibrio halodurans]MBP5857742.1 S8 family serine peptidase [Marivibrio halodurans]